MADSVPAPAPAPAPVPAAVSVPQLQPEGGECSTTTILIIALLSTAVAYWLMTMPCANSANESDDEFQHEYRPPALAVEDEVLDTPFGPKCATSFIFDDAVEISDVENSATERVKESFLMSRINRLLQKSL